eukprot:evm.model.NODE_19096_length_41527_cov_31.861897.12
MTEPINLCLGYEQRTLDSLTRPFTLPVTIITGFLGSGKTTLMRSLLAQKRNLRIATLINDLGEFNHDVQLLELVTTTTADSSHQPASDRVMDLHGNCLCCSSLHQEMRQNVWECLQTPDGEARAVDYLVIETSGVTDPETLIRALDEKFGKMTRARLDSVVTVVDADVLYSELTLSIDRATNAAADADSSVVRRGRAPTPPPLMSTARRHQLECADVILLNKIDLLQDSTQLETVEACLRSLNPLARIHRTRYAEVPLPCVLDVELPDVGIGQMTHETGAANFATRKASTLRSQASRNLRTRGKAENLRTESTSAAAAAASLASADKNSMATHLITDGLSAFTFESARPFLLHKLQSFFSHIFPAEAVVRCKGFMHIRDLPGRRVTLSMSGRRRFHVSDEGPWQSAPKTQLVFIGQEPGFDKAVIEVALEEACADWGANMEKGGDDGASASAQLAAKVRALVAQDKRMELVDLHTLLAPLLFPRMGTNAEESELSLPMWVNCLVAFRLTGAPSLGVTSEHLRLTHGVDLNAMSRALQAKINMAGIVGMPLLYTLPFGGGEGDVALCFVVEEGEEAEGRGETYFTKTWEWMVSAAANSVIARFLGHLKLCKCGH